MRVLSAVALPATVLAGLVALIGLPAAALLALAALGQMLVFRPVGVWLVLPILLFDAVLVAGRPVVLAWFAHFTFLRAASPSCARRSVDVNLRGQARAPDAR
jgi:hypothetical protein